jgi:hypothetical protein
MPGVCCRGRLWVDFGVSGKVETNLCKNILVDVPLHRQAHTSKLVDLLSWRRRSFFILSCSRGGLRPLTHHYKRKLELRTMREAARHDNQGVSGERLIGYNKDMQGSEISTFIPRPQKEMDAALITKPFSKSGLPYPRFSNFPIGSVTISNVMRQHCPLPNDNLQERGDTQWKAVIMKCFKSSQSQSRTIMSSPQISSSLAKYQEFSFRRKSLFHFIENAHDPCPAIATGLCLSL